MLGEAVQPTWLSSLAGFGWGDGGAEARAIRCRAVHPRLLSFAFTCWSSGAGRELPREALTASFGSFCLPKCSSWVFRN